MFESRTPWPIVFLSQSQSRLRIGGDFQRKMGPVIRNTPKLSLARRFGTISEKIPRRTIRHRAG